jgi:hypothetical protein
LVVWKQPLADFRDVTAAPHSRFETRAQVEIPQGAMHSFSSAHNVVRWRLVVRGTPDRWPAFTRVFPVVVFPPAAEGVDGTPRRSAAQDAQRSTEMSR